MQGITPHLWFDTQAVEAAEFYTDTFPGSRLDPVVTLPDTPSGDVESITFELFGQPFLAISAGPYYRFEPSVILDVACASPEEVERFGQRLSAGGSVSVAPGSAPEAEDARWITDRYGLSWRLSVAPDVAAEQRITPTLVFAGDVRGRAEEAIRAYTATFPGSSIERIDRAGPDAGPDAADQVRYASFRLAGQRFAAVDAGPGHDAVFNEAISLLVNCDDQAELDRYTEALSTVPEAEQCGWVKDRFGLSWQLSPTALDRMLAEGSPEQVARVTRAFLGMRRLDLAALERAYAGEAATTAG